MAWTNQRASHVSSTGFGDGAPSQARPQTLRTVAQGLQCEYGSCLSWLRGPPAAGKGEEGVAATLLSALSLDAAKPLDTGARCLGR